MTNTSPYTECAIHGSHRTNSPAASGYCAGVAQAAREAKHLAAIKASTHDCDTDPRCAY